MKDVLHAILSELHHILSIGSPDELRAAGRLASVSENMKTALEALAKERAENVQTGAAKSSRPVTKTDTETATTVDPQQREPALNLFNNDEERRIYRLLMASPKFSDKAAIRSLIDEAGIAVQIRSKDGRDRTARKVARAIHNAPDSRKARALATLMDRQDKQTQGWINVIRGSR